ncbi:hypothetical protein [Pseudoalteromonas rubra]|uniref:Filamentous haemagglutinin FhaB/tRNA nuclease CdiA-like TPS domain-containing protein n=1 Tax=Pseudoalteromonas rubra TaxID=43658 RepID=A0A0F4QU26_9GAMM|nr:hypothetical protein [Pseudoalteromonas rubra]KJZ11168.1 hypothetical protein TW77_06560 [Pseudoalteromonas rubra]
MRVIKITFVCKLIVASLLVHFKAHATTEPVAGYEYNTNSNFTVAANEKASSDFLIVNGDSETTELTFERFEVSNKPLLIKLSNTSQVKTIVINSRYLKLRNSISIIGKSVNLMFVSTDGTLECTRCVFDNAERITLVHGSYQHSDGGLIKGRQVDGSFGGSALSSKPTQTKLPVRGAISGRITTNASGRVTINNLSAPGAHSLEVMADHIVTSGTIDLNLRAQRHPQGGFIFAENGSYVLGSGGINLYPGRLTIKYSDLDVLSASTKNEVYQPGGIFKAASIGIVAAQPVTIPSATELNTMSDALATSTRQGHFHAPAEGVFIQVAKHESALLTVRGKLYSDRIVTTKTIGGTTFSADARIMAQTVKAFGDDYILNHGYIDADNIKVDAERFINTGTLNGSEVVIETNGDVHNAFGGVITAGNLSAVLTNGMFTNGSRTNRSIQSASMPLMAPSIRVDSTSHGPYSLYDQAGVIQSRLSAKIHANTITIAAKAIENINPYHISEPRGVDWSKGIRVNTVQADRVSIAAESSLALKAQEYIRNTSAIMRLNQAGLFQIDTPLMFNDRYRLETTSYVVSRFAYSGENLGSHDIVEQGHGTKISAYSPPGRVISFGRFDVGSKNVPSTRRRFVNAFSYIELFGEARFQKLDLESIGILLNESIVQEHVSALRLCVAHRICDGGQSNTHVTTSVEGETLLSIHGNVYGINPNVDTQSQFSKTNVDSDDDNLKEKINEYFQQYVSRTDEDTYQGYYAPRIIDEGTVVLVHLYRCDGYRIVEHGLIEERNCDTYDTLRVPLSTVIGSNSDADFGGTGYTFAALSDAAKRYASTRLPTRSKDSRCEPQIGSDVLYSCTAQGYQYQDVVVIGEGDQVTIRYHYQIYIEKTCDTKCDNKRTTIAVTHNLTVNVTELMAAQ